MFVSVPRRLHSQVSAAFPSDCCCNCGTQEGRSIVPTRLVKTTYLGFGGVEKSVTAPLPFCAGCSPTATRLPKGLGAKLLVSGVVFFGLVLAVSVLGATRPLPRVETTTALWGLGAVSVSLVFGFYALRRPSGAQTSWYQPVRLVKLRQQFLGGTVTGYVFAFTNPRYRELFAVANADAIRRGTIKAR